jgi:hypothetical protein
MNLNLEPGSCNFVLCTLQLNVHEKMKAHWNVFVATLLCPSVWKIIVT